LTWRTTTIEVFNSLAGQWIPWPSSSGVPAEGITGIRRNENGWVVEVEVLEVERVPETSDVLASYEVEIDNDGES
jgi:hypothetical protein